MSPRVRRPQKLAPPQQRPCGNGNFLVDLGMGDPRAPEAGFCEVIFPDFLRGGVTPAPSTPTVQPCVVLRRAATGALDLYEWWSAARSAKTPAPRTVVVELLGADLASPVMRWRFLKATPVGLGYSPLNAQTPGLLYESLSLAFEQVEMG